MKTTKIIIITLLSVIGLTACDSNKGDIEEKAKQFAEALKNKDVATIYDMYPGAKNLSNTKLPDSMQPGDIDVEKDESTGNYTATLKNGRDQKLVFKVMGKDKYQITDSYPR